MILKIMYYLHYLKDVHVFKMVLCANNENCISHNMLCANCIFFYYSLNLDVDDGISDSLLPDTPAATICIPIISRAIAIISPANIAPKIGDATIITDIITAKIPTPIVKPLTQPLLALFVTPSIIRPNPSIISANPKMNITTIAVATG